MSRLNSLVLATALISITASASEVVQTQYLTRGDGAEAGFWAGDDCVSKSAWLYVSENLSTANGDRQGFTGGSLSFSNYNWCNWSEVYGWVDLTGASFDGRGIQGATMTFEGTGYTETFLGCEQVTCGCVSPDPAPVCEPGTKCRVPGCDDCDEASGECNWCWCGDEGCFRDVCHWETRAFPVSIDLTWTPDGSTSRGTSNSTYTSAYSMSHMRSVGSNASCGVSGSVLIDGVEYAAPGGWGSSSTTNYGSVTIEQFSR